MQRFSTKLIAITTAIALVVASFVAFTHSHSHHGSHSHGGDVCCGHHSTVVHQDDHAHSCCHGHDHDVSSVAIESAGHGLQLANTDHKTHAEHLCAICIHRTQHSANVSLEFHAQQWSCISPVPDAVAFSPTLSLVSAYYLRGPPQV